MEITTWYLEQTSPADLLPTAEPGLPLTIMQAQHPTPEFSRFLYTAVGGPWHWRGRLPWTWRQWEEWLDKPGLQTWVVYLHGTPAGYAELVPHDDGSIEVNSFGLLPSFVGKGIGRYFLWWVLDHAWQHTATRVWLHTCSLDSPHALANYQARGLRVYDIKVGSEDLPDRPPGPWPGASV
jgi:GNAT superfamily N-acetyltransferase